MCAGSLVDQVDRLLPQTQCSRCGYPACRPYAEALAAGEADINRCPPGGAATLLALARTLGVEAKPLDPSCGETGPPSVAAIEEHACIGCTLCLQACPVDAIVGAAGQMHTVIKAECTGCALCIEPCPVDCIRMHPAPFGTPHTGSQAWREGRAVRARRRHQARRRRLQGQRERAQRKQLAAARRRSRAAKQAAIAAAVARVRARRRSAPGHP
jgi:electron transport complex protein RnfB